MKKILALTFSYFFLQPISIQSLQAMNHHYHKAYEEIEQEKNFPYNTYKDTRETSCFSEKTPRCSLRRIIKYLLTIGVPTSVIIALLIKH